MGTLQALIDRLSPDKNVRGRQFEHICKWYLQADPVYAHQLRHVWLWKEWPEHWGIDAGIDLVAETYTGDLWAIQSKAYNPTRSVTKADVDTFLSESGRPQFSFRLLITTTDRIGTTARRTFQGQAIDAHFRLRVDLEHAEVDWPESPSDLPPRRRVAKQPYPHSLEAVEAVCGGFERHDRGQLIMACGTGKTLVGLWVAERLQCDRTLVLVPSLSLVSQTLREWSASAAKPFSWLAVCSDPSVRGEDDLVEHTTELGFPVTTDPGEIAAALGRPGRHVVFATYQSSPRLVEAVHIGAPPFDLAIADEAHRCAGSTGTDFATIVEPAAIVSKRRLFMTATPRYLTSRTKTLAQRSELELISMDDEQSFGPVFHRLSFGEAIERGLLSDYRVAIIGVDDDTCRSYAERAALVTTDRNRTTDARTLAGQIGLAKAMHNFGLRRVVSFHSRVLAARDFAESLPEVVAWMPEAERPEDTIWASHISGAMSSGDRGRLLHRLEYLDRGERGLLANARCLAEGVDVPAIDGICFVDPRRSAIDITQAVGRAIRRSEEKTHGTVVLPVFVASTMDSSEALDASAFRPVWEVLRALRAHDEVLGEQLDELRRELGRRGTGPLRLPPKITIDLPVGVSPAFADAFRVSLVEWTTASFEYWFGLLEQYVQREGHARAPRGYLEDGYALGNWVNKQRMRYGRGTLSTDRRERLTAVPGWTWNAHEDSWDKGFAALSQFVARCGHTHVPRQLVESGVNLGSWVTVQRSQHRRGELPDERVSLLSEVPGWEWDPMDARWEEGIDSLSAYVRRTDNTRVPDSYVDEVGYPLGVWVVQQRIWYRKGTLPSSRVRQLESFPAWVWDERAALWEEGYAALASFVERSGASLVPTSHVENGYPLGKWVAWQRAMFRQGKLPEDRVTRLATLNGWAWDAQIAKWDRAFSALVAYVDREGPVRIPHDCIEQSVKLGQWVSDQRLRYARGKLTEDRASRLASVPGWRWKPRQPEDP